jgi:predicted Zn-dependent protease
MPLPRLPCLLGVGLVAFLSGSGAPASHPDRLVSRPLPEASLEKTQSVGDRVVAPAGRGQRLLLPDRTVVYLRERSRLTVKAADRVELSAGEAFFETAAGKRAPTLTITTPTRELRARHGRFGVRIDKQGTSVVVASGSAQVVGLDEAVRAGQTLTATGKTATAAPRVSHLLGWTRELRSAALVPASPHAGGSLIARDPEGQEVRLKMRRCHIDVYVEDGFARTTIEQTYFNESQDRLEGTFRLPLPPDASLSRLAMYVDGKLMEGGMAERDYARSVYERIVWEKRDPALLEWVDGSTFKMRVFPLEPRQEKRLLLGYTQRLGALYGEHSIRFPAGHGLEQVGHWSLRLRLRGGAGIAWRCESHPLKERKDGDDLLLEASAKDARPDRDVVLRWQAPGGQAEEARFAGAELEGKKYLMLRYRPHLEGAAAAPRRDWVVLVETSADRDPLLARTQVELVRALLHAAGSDDTFRIVTASTRTRQLSAKPITNEPGAVDEALAELEKAHLVGALDLGKALADVKPLLEGVKAPWLLHMGSGIAAMGENRTKELLAHFPNGARYVGVGVGRRWDRSFMRAAAERTGGYFSQVNPDEPVAWRGLDLLMTLNTPRLLDVSVTDRDGKERFLPFAALLCQGEELAAVARVEGDFPKAVRVRGRLEGKEFVRDLEVKDVRGKAGYLPRSWAKLEIDRLLAEDARKHRPAIVELSKAMYVMSPFTSLLVLESDDQYKQFKVDRGRKDHWAMYPAPAKIKVVVEPIDGDPGDAGKGIKPSARVVANTVVRRQLPRVFRTVEPRAAVTPEALNSLGALAVTSGKTLSGEPSIYFPTPARGAPVLKGLNDAEAARDTNERGSRAERLYAARAIDVWTFNRLETTSSLEKKFDLTNTDLGMNEAPRKPAEPARIEAMSADGSLLPTAGELGAPVNPYLNLLRGGATPGVDYYTLARSPGLQTEAGVLPVFGRYRGEGGGGLLYLRPGYSGDERLFFDLLGYAPGLNTSCADLLAVLDAEARANPASRPGTIGEGVRQVFAKARKAAWRTLTVPEQGRSPAYRISFDGTGRHAWERTLPSGLRERVACDGKTLWHLYPELGLAAKRSVSRAHRLALWHALPWVLPLPEDLARGADLELAGDTVVVTPHAAREDGEGKGRRAGRSGMTLHLVFVDGRLIERRWVWRAEKKVPRRETYSADGTVKVFDREDKVVFARKWALEDGGAPELKPAVKGLVVLDLPFRTPAHVRRTLELEKKQYNELTFAEAETLLAAFAANGEPEPAKQVFLGALGSREQRRLGYYVLLAAAGVNLDSDNLDVLEAHPHEPLAHYLALHSSPLLRKHASRWAAASNPFGRGTLRRLALGHALCQRWATGKSLGASPAQRQAERRRLLAYVERYPGTELAWALLGLAQDRAGEEHGDAARAAFAELAGAYAAFARTPGLAGHARYEQARCLFKAGRYAPARQRFLGLFREAVKHGGLLAIDPDFRAALLGGKADGWSALLRGTASELVKRKDRFAVLGLAQVCWQLGDAPLSRHLLARALKDAPKGKEGVPLHKAALLFLSESSQAAEADRLVRGLLEEPENAKDSALWRAAARLAGERERPARRLECLEKALELEFSSPAEVVNLQQVRSDYGALLEQYETLVRALATLKLPAPVGFRDRVVRAADRWRALDRDQQRAANAAARVLRALGERELAWDYLTTPVALRPGESEVWVGLAQALRKQGERDLADRAYRAAFAREAGNAQLLWDRADNLRQAGRLAQARELYRQIAQGRWQPRFAALVTQARWMLDGE